MFYRFRTLIALVSIALMAIDAVVGVAGHSHADYPAVCAAASECQGHGGGCAHEHLCATACETESSTEQPSNSDPHDDCSLCRHFSQPVVTAVFAVEIVDSERIEPLAVRLVAGVAAAILRVHSARGPPAFCA